MHSRPRLAVLIDAENISHKRGSEIFARVTLLGEPEIRIAFGDWTTSRLAGWKEIASERAIRLECQLPCTQHKNGSDIALAVEAMDLLHLSRPDGFVIVSGDSDFTPLVTRLRERMRLVYIIGGANTSSVLRAACTDFFELSTVHGTEVAATDSTTLARPTAVSIAATNAIASKAAAKKPISKKGTSPPARQPMTSEIEGRLHAAIEKSAGTDGWASMSVFGKHVDRDIRPNNFGHSTWIKLFTGRKGFQIRKKPHAAVRSTGLSSRVS